MENAIGTLETPVEKKENVAGASLDAESFGADNDDLVDSGLARAPEGEEDIGRHETSGNIPPEIADDKEEPVSKDSVLISQLDSGVKEMLVEEAPEPDRQCDRHEQAPSRSTTDPVSGGTSWTLGFTQLLALLRKNALSKFRTPAATLLELTSPVLMMLVLVAAYNISEVVYKEPKVYSAININLPGPFVSLVREAVSFTDDLLGRRLTLEEDDLDELKHPIWTSWPSASDFFELARLHRVDLDSLQLAPSDVRHLQFSTADDDEAFDDETSSDDENLLDLLDAVRRQIKRLMKNPIPTPTFQQYVGLGSAIGDLINVDELPEIFSDSDLGRTYANLLSIGTLHLSPNNNRAATFLRYMNESYPSLVDQVRFRIHETEDEAVRFIDKNLNERTWALLDFSAWSNEPTEEAFYKIRMNYTMLPNTREISSPVAVGLDTAFQRYYFSGFMTLQRTLNEFTFATYDETCRESIPENIWSMPMPTAAFSQNTFYLAVGSLLGLSIVMAYLYPTSRLIKTIVEEKEMGMKETMLILGVRPWAHWWSWLITSLVVFFVITVLVTLALARNILKNSAPAYLFWWIWFFSTANTGFCFAVAACFSRAKLAAIIGPMALFASVLPRFIFFGFNRYEATTQKMWASLLPASAFAFGADIVADYEYGGQGIQTWNADEGDYSFNTSVGFLFLDTIIYIILGWYLEQVIPQRFGKARPLHFIVSPFYWFGWLLPRRRVDHVEAASSKNESSSKDHEPVEATALPTVVVNDLVKRYSKKQDSKPAVNNLNLAFYESHITALLGHNGSGKTTTVAALTGLLTPTSGDCVIYGSSMVDDSDAARRSIGICPQENILFGDLTVLEHISFFQKMKGVRASLDVAKRHAEEVGLSEFLHTISSALSGGNKRKLCLAIALCGDPKLLILDEPTSGMDPRSRRACWEVLRRRRIGRVTIITTHFMDEAELLADRIAVLKEGELQCSGSPLFLKERFGLGYNLTVVLEPTPGAGGSGEDIEGAESDDASDRHPLDAEDRVLDLLQSYMPTTELGRRFGKELSFRLPIGAEERLPDALDALESARKSIGFGDFGIENSSLEEVFILLAESESAGCGESSLSDIDCQDQAKTPGDAIQGIVPTGTGGDVTLGLVPQLVPQLGVLYSKRFTIQKRDLKGAFFLIVVPVILIGMVLVILTIDVPIVGPPIQLSPDLFVASPTEMTEVFVGGGAQGDARSVDLSFDRMESLMTETYNMRFRRTHDMLNSNDLSHHLLDTYNDRDHGPRFGAFVFGDSIDINVAMSWDDLLNDVKTLLEEVSGRSSTVDVIELVTGEQGEIALNVTTDTILRGVELLGLFPSDSVVLDVVLSGIRGLDEDLIDAAEPFVTSLLIDGLRILSDGLVQMLESIVRDVAGEVGLSPRQAVEALVAILEGAVGVLDSSELVGSVVLEWLNVTATSTLPQLANLTQNAIDFVANEAVNIPLQSLTSLIDEAMAARRSLEQDLVQIVEEQVAMLSTFLLEAFLDVTELLKSSLGSGSTNITIPGVPQLTNETALEIVNLIEAVVIDLVETTNATAMATVASSISNILESTLQVPDAALNNTAFFLNQTIAALNSTNALARTLLEYAIRAVDDLGALKFVSEMIDSAFDAFAEPAEAILEQVISFLNGVIESPEVDDWESGIFQIVGEVMSPSLREITRGILSNGIELVQGLSDQELKARLESYVAFLFLAGLLPSPSLDLVLVDILTLAWDTLSEGFVEMKATAVVLDPVSARFSISGLELGLGSFVFWRSEEIWFSLDQAKELLPSGDSAYVVGLKAQASVIHNASSAHAVGIYNQAYAEFLFKECTASRSARLVSINHPLPLTTDQTIEVKTALSVLASLFILIPLCYVPGAFVVFQVKEKTCKSKHLQLASGVNLACYWIASYLWDVTLVVLLTILIMLTLLAFNDSAEVFVGDIESFTCTALLLLGYGVSILPFSYLVARRFRNHSSAQIIVIGVVFLSGFVAVTAFFVMDSLESTKDLAETLQPYFRWWPAYNLGEGLVVVGVSFWERRVLGRDKFPLDWDVGGRSIALVFSLAIPYFGLLMLVEYADEGGAGGTLGRCLRSAGKSCEALFMRCYGVRRLGDGLFLNDGLQETNVDDDDDVARERKLVAESTNSLKHHAPLIYANVWKVYPPSVGLLGVLGASCARMVTSIFCCRWTGRPQIVETGPGENAHSRLPKRAVRGLTTAVHRGETFALLGQNGCGKSTTMSMTTADVSPTLGEIYVCGHDVSGKEFDGVTKARKRLGYCPQVDPLLELMTVRETLTMYARLRGIRHVDIEVERLLDRLSLGVHSEKASEQLSGGNKRKLSLGIAIVGNPDVLLIDESSSGLDPVSKRRMWNLISEVSRDRAVVLTTHSMQEAEALCSRASIMAAGKLLCLGTVQHLKTKYLDGYSVDIFLRPGLDPATTDAFVDELLSHSLPGCSIIERHGRFLRVEVSSMSSLGLGTLFRRLEVLKRDPAWHVENYSVSQCSLEQVFISLVDKEVQNG